MVISKLRSDTPDSETVVSVWLSRNEDCYTGQHLYAGLLIDLLKDSKNGFVLDEYSVNKQENNIFNRIKYSMLKIAPMSSVRYYHKEFTTNLLSYLERKYSHRRVIVHFMYAPETIVYNIEFNTRNVNDNHSAVISMPDYFSQYYLQLFKNSMWKLKYFFDYLLYRRLENMITKYSKMHVVGESLNSLHNCTPNMVSVSTVTNEVKKSQKIFVPLPHERLLKILFEDFEIHRSKIEFVILLREPAKLSYLNRFKSKNIEIINFIDNYDDFANRFFIHLCYDPAGTGMSTKVATACKLGCVPLGNKIAFRGLKSIPDEWLCDFDNVELFYESINTLHKLGLKRETLEANVQRFFQKNWKINDYLREIYR